MFKHDPSAEVIIVNDDTDTVCCDGGHGALGHPAVYYDMRDQDCVECGYCDRVFVRQSAFSRQSA